MKSDIRAGRAYVELLLKNSAFMKGLKNAKDRLGSFGRGIATLGAGISAVGASILGPLMKAVTHFASTGDELDKMSNRTGATAQFLAEMGFAAEQAGQGLGTIEKGLIGSQKFVSDARRGLATAKDGLDALGLSLSDFEGKNAEEQFDLITDRLAGMEDATQRNDAAMLAFGKKMGPAIASISDGLREARAEARDLGLAPSQESVSRAAQVTDAINRVRRVIGATVYEIGAALAPAVLKALGAIKNIALAAQRWVKENQSLFVTLAGVGSALVAAGAAVTAIGFGFIAAGAAVGGFITLLTAMASTIAFVTSPVGIILASLAGLATWFVTSTEAGKNFVSKLKDLFGDLAQTAKDTFGGIADALSAGNVQLAAQIAMQGVRVALMQAVAKFQDDWKPFIEFVLNGWDIIKTVWDGLSKAVVSAWNTMAELLKDAWEYFVEFFGLGTSDAGDMFGGFAAGLVSIFTKTVNTVLDIWEKAVNSIAKGLFDAAHQEGAIGNIARTILGRDPREDEAQWDENTRKRVTIVRQEISGMEEALASASGDTVLFEGEEVAVGDLKDRLAIYRKQLADLGADTGLRQFGYGAIEDQTAAIRSEVEDMIDGLGDRIGQRSRQSAGELTGINDESIAAARAQLEEFRRLAGEQSKAQADEAAKRQQEAVGGGFNSSSAKQSTVAVFSSSMAYALQQGGGNDPVVEEQRKANQRLENLEQINSEQLFEFKEFNRNMVLT